MFYTSIVNSNIVFIQNLMAQNNEDLLNKDINESIIKLDNIDPKREEQLMNFPLAVGNRVIRDYDGQQQINSRRKFRRSNGY